MNPVILKALIISGGTIGLGVPSIYYGYPHIAKLVSPVVEENQTASGGKIQEATEETETNGEKVSEGLQTENLPTREGNDDSTTHLEGKASETTDSTGQENQPGSSDNGGVVNDNSGGRSSNSSGKETVTQDNSQRENSQNGQQ